MPMLIFHPEVDLTLPGAVSMPDRSAPLVARSGNRLGCAAHASSEASLGLACEDAIRFERHALFCKNLV
jgi:hypothetical protein